MSSKLRGATEEAAIQTIPPLHLVAAAIPALLVLLVLWWWRADVAQGFIALARMVAQLLLVGYVLVYIFEADTPWIVLSVLVVMVVTASWIALRTVPSVRGALPSCVCVGSSGGWSHPRARDAGRAGSRPLVRAAFRRAACRDDLRGFDEFGEHRCRALARRART